MRSGLRPPSALVRMAGPSHGFDLTREAQHDGGYDSTNEDDEGAVEAKRARRDLAGGKKYDKKGKAKVHKSAAHEEASFETGRGMRSQLLTMNAYDRHKSLINSYQLYYPGATASLQRDTRGDRRDIDVIKEHHRLLWTEADDEESWEVQLAKRYHDKLFKEYVIIDLSRYKENQFGMRWRQEAEVVAGKGQFVCASKRCEERRKLRTWEVNFGYVEQQVKKNALIKCRLCFDCSYKLNYHHKKKEVTKKKKHKKKSKKIKKHKRSRSSSESSDSSDDESLRRKRKKEEKLKAEAKEAKEKEKEKKEKDVWSKPLEVEEEKTREDEFDEFLDDLFL